MPICRGIKVSEDGVLADIWFDKARAHKLIRTENGIEAVVSANPHGKLMDIEALKRLQGYANGEETLRDPNGEIMKFSDVFFCMNICSRFHEVDPSFGLFMDFKDQSPAVAASTVETMLRRA
jgi:hypothetical protein